MHPLTPLNGRFGAMLEDVTPADLADAAFRARAKSLWHAHGGLFVARGAALADIRPEALIEFGGAFGHVDRKVLSGREHCMVGGTPVLRIGNVRNEAGERIATFVNDAEVERDEDVRYDPVARRPGWHTDSIFLPKPPIGSVFQCRKAPARGGHTLFADTRSPLAALDQGKRAELEELEAVCSLAHHDKKISLYTPGYHILDDAQRKANPPRRVPIVLEHPDTGEPALYGLNGSTCAIVPKGAPVSEADMDRYDLEGVEDESVGILRNLLPFVTGPEYTVRWRWQPGDIVVWDNRCTLHAGTGFDDETSEREMWRLSLLGEVLARTP